MREAWGLVSPRAGRVALCYAADVSGQDRAESLGDVIARDVTEVSEAVRLYRAGRRWRPSIHMPRWAARLTLEVVDARAERLHDIDDEDARREGVADRAAFERLWAAIHGAASWESNPFVWRVEFRVVRS